MGSTYLGSYWQCIRISEAPLITYARHTDTHTHIDTPIHTYTQLITHAYTHKLHIQTHVHTQTHAHTQTLKVLRSCIKP